MSRLTERINSHRIALPTLDTRIHGPELRMVRDYFGKPGLELISSVHRPDRKNSLYKDPERLSNLQEEADKIFFSKMREEVSFGREPELSFYRRQMTRANKVIYYLIKELGLPLDQYSLRNEADVIPDSPSSRLMLVGDFNGVDKTLRFEIMRQMLLALAIAPLDIRAEEEQLETNLSRMNEFLSENVYIGPIGKTGRVDVYSQHDGMTNTVLRYSLDKEGNDFGHDRKVRSKKTPVRVRDTVFKERVLTNIRHKGEAESLLKSIQKALAEEKPIDVLESVQDSVGMQFVIMGDKRERDEFIVNFESALASNYNDFSSIQKDDIPDSRRGQNPAAFEKRSLLRLKTLSIPIEIMYLSIEEYLNYIYETGLLQDGIEYDGRAHALYELRRLNNTVPHLIPPEIYGNHLEDHVALKMSGIADDLRTLNSY